MKIEVRHVGEPRSVLEVVPSHRELGPKSNVRRLYQPLLIGRHTPVMLAAEKPVPSAGVRGRALAGERKRSAKTAVEHDGLAIMVWAIGAQT